MSVFVFIIFIVGIVIFGDVASKWLAARRQLATPDPEREAEVQRLRARVDELSERVEELAEEQRFTTRLLEDAAGVETDSHLRGSG